MAKTETASATNRIHGKKNGTPWSWKFNSIQFEYKQTHPFES